MIPLYIVLYLVVGLVVKWLCERYEKEEFTHGEFYIICFWPIFVVLFPILILLDYLDNIDELDTIYTRIRKFFRGF